MAEREGFEPSVEFPPHVISSHADSAWLSHLSAGLDGDDAHTVSDGAERERSEEVGEVALALRTNPYGGEGGIRTHDTLSGITVFETVRFNHLRTSPRTTDDHSIPSPAGT